MRCILHVGTEKTATTTLQRFADDHRHDLPAVGFAYTRSAGIGNNWRLAVAAYDDDRHDDRSAAAGVDDGKSRHTFRASLLADLRSELHTAATGGAHTVLFSSEHLHSRLTRPAEIERLAQLLGDLGVTDTRVVIYLRDPVALAASLHSTMVKHGSTRRQPPAPEPGTYYRNLCDHRASIERWEAVFGSVTPRLFDADALIDGSIVADLWATIGVTGVPANPNAGDRQLNRSLSTAEVEVLSRLNERIPHMVDGAPNPTHVALVAQLERHSTGAAYRLPPRLAERYREEFAASNEWVRQRYFPERATLFSADASGNRSETTGPGYDGLAAVLADLCQRVPVDGRLEIVEAAE